MGIPAMGVVKSLLVLWVRTRPRARASLSASSPKHS
jgi:hypothetical protein